MRAQLLVRLREKIKRVWHDVIGPDDHLGIHVVRPVPFADGDGTRYLPILAEANRPGRCTLQPVLFAVREITALGVDPPDWCACLVPSVFSVADVYEACQPAGEPHQLLVPQGTSQPRWMNSRHTRVANAGLFVPVWWDDRLPLEEVAQDSTSLLRLRDSVIPPWPTLPLEFTSGDEVWFMQKPGPSMSPTLGPVRLYGLRNAIATVTVDNASPLLEQLEPMWPAHLRDYADLHSLHYVASPPAFTSSPQATTYLMRFNDDHFSQVHEDDILALISIIMVSPERKQRLRVQWAPCRTTRNGLLEFLRFGWYCQQPDILCFLYLNEVMWPLDDNGIRHLDNGDSIKVQLRSERFTWCDIAHSERIARARRFFVSSDEEVADEDATAPRSTADPSSQRSRSRDRSRSIRENIHSEDSSESYSLLQRSATWTSRSAFPPDEWQRSTQNELQRLIVDPHVSDRWCEKQCDADSSFVPVPSLGWSQDAKDSPETQPAIDVDFSQVIRNFEWLDNHFALACFDLPSDFPLFQESIDWIQLPWWDFQDEVAEVHIYVDGSAEAEGSGAGIAVFISSGYRWFFAGAFSSSLDKVDSYRAELAAAIFGLKVAHDICKLIGVHQENIPVVVLKFDALTVGNQLLGNWASHKAPTDARILRSLVSLISTRFGVSVLGEHIPSHRGEPGNELADVLAGQASKGRSLHDFRPFLDFICTSEFAGTADWFWMLFRDDLCWQGHNMIFPAVPTTCPTAECMPADDSSTQQVRNFEVSLRMATINVLTLKGSKGHEAFDETGLGGPTRKDIVLGQLAEAEVQIFDLQETRTALTVQKHTKDFWLFYSAATSRGHFGMMIGFSKVLPIAHGPEGPVYFTESDFAVISTSPRTLIIRVKSCPFKAIVVAAHAPHTGASVDDITTFWQELSAAIPIRYAEWPRLLLADANVRIGSVTSSHIGSHQAETDTEKSEPFRNFLAEEAVWLLATFEEFQQGPGVTWKSLTRNDFIGISQLWDFKSCHTWVDPFLDMGLQAEDHSAAMLDLEITISSHQAAKPQLGFRKYDEESVLQYCGGWGSDFSDYLWDLQPCGWHVDIHTHTRLVEEAITCKLDCTISKVKKPTRQVMSDATWDLVQQKRGVRAQLAQYNDIRIQFIKSACFLGWRNGAPSQQAASAYAAMQKELDVNIAVSLGEFRTLGRLVTTAIRKDDCAFFSNLAQEGADVYDQGSSKQFWNVIRRSLPKFRQRRLCLAPMKIEGLEDQWESYFQDLEVGQPMTKPGLVSACFQHQSDQHPDRISRISLDELPSLSEVEHEFRATSAYRSTGFDPILSGLFRACAPGMAKAHFDVVLKHFLWQTEPIQSKGGPLIVIPKRPHASEVSQFRGIMLLPTLAKRVHALLRRRIMSLLGPVKPLGQLGGFARQLVGFGSQPLRVLGRLLDCRGLTSGVLFVDLANAFHCLVRELVTGMVVPGRCRGGG